MTSSAASGVTRADGEGRRRMSIFDHMWRPDQVGQVRTDRCDLCGEPKSAHVLDGAR